jgi:hypothetical protein
MQRLFDQLISNMRSIEVAGVDMVDAKLDDLAQDRECAVMVGWRPKYMRTASCIAPYPMRVRIKSSASLNVPPSSVVDVIKVPSVWMSRVVTVSPGAGIPQWRDRAACVLIPLNQN